MLAALLKQNPRFCAGMTSPVGGLVSNMISQFSAGSEFSNVVTATQKQNLLHGVFSSYYADRPDKEVIFDTNRAWAGRMPLVLDLFPDAKIIACVRNVAWIMDSIERLFRNNPYENTRLFGNNMQRSTVYSRLEGLAQHDQMVGFAWSALREAFYGEQAKSLLVLDYDLLTQSPEKVMPLIYRFIDEPLFTHDFENVEYDAPEFDQQLGTPGLHYVRPKVAPSSRRSLLPPDLFEKFSKMTFWTDPSGSAANVVAPKMNVTEI